MFSAGSRSLLCVLVACLTAGVTGVTARGDQPDVSAIMARSLDAMRADWRAAPNYEHLERDRTADGTKTYASKMIEGSPYAELVAIDNRPLAPATRAAEDAKLRAVITRRQAETANERADRIRKYDESRQHDHKLIEQMAEAFDFTLVGKQPFASREAYVLRATPRRGYVPPTLEARALTGMQGTLWIDTETFQWIKVTADVTHPVSIEGVLARVEPGTSFTLENVPVGDGIWQPARFLMRATSKILFFFTHRAQEDETYFHYRPIGSPNQ